MVLVLMGGEILQRFITLAEPVSQEQLSEAARPSNKASGRKKLEEVSGEHLAERTAWSRIFYQIVHR